MNHGRKRRIFFLSASHHCRPFLQTGRHTGLQRPLELLQRSSFSTHPIPEQCTMVRVRQHPIRAHLQGDARLGRPGRGRERGAWRQGAKAVDRRGGGWGDMCGGKVHGLHVRHQSFAQPYFAYLSHWSHGAHLLLAETAPPTRASSRCEAGYAALIPPSHGARCAEGEPNLRLQRGCLRDAEPKWHEQHL